MHPPSLLFGGDYAPPPPPCGRPPPPGGGRGASTNVAAATWRVEPQSARTAARSADGGESPAVARKELLLTLGPRVASRGGRAITVCEAATLQWIHRIPVPRRCVKVRDFEIVRIGTSIRKSLIS